MSESGQGSGKSRSILTAWPRAVVGKPLGNKSIWQSRKSPAVRNACVQSSSALAQTTQKVFVWHWVAMLFGIRYLQDHTEGCLCSDRGQEEQSSCARKISQPEFPWAALICLFQRKLHAGMCHVICIHFVQQHVQCTNWRGNGAWKGP